MYKEPVLALRKSKQEKSFELVTVLGLEVVCFINLAMMETVGDSRKNLS